MKIHFTILIMGIVTIAYSQIGVGTYNIDPTAAIQINAHKNPTDLNNGGILIPRVDLVTLSNSATPVAAPVDGTLIYNKTENTAENLNKGLYFWNSDSSLWEHGLYYRQTPKTSVIRFSGGPTDFFVLDDANAGFTARVGTTSLFPDNFIYDSFASFMGLSTYYYVDPATSVAQNSISIAPGKYLIEISFACVAPPCNPTTRCSYVAGDYYYMGMLIDLYLPEYLADGSVVIGPRRRKEDGVISKAGQNYRITEYYSIEITGENFKLQPRLGRMSGSSFNDGVYVIPAESYIKISKY